MTQTYGIARDTDGDNDTHADDGEASALLGGEASGGRKAAKVDGHASIISCVSNLSNTIIGSGVSEPFFQLDSGAYSLFKEC